MTNLSLTFDDGFVQSLTTAASIHRLLVINGGARQFDRLNTSSGIKSFESILRENLSPSRIFVFNPTDDSQQIRVVHGADNNSEQTPDNLYAIIQSLKQSPNRQILIVNADTLFTDNEPVQEAEITLLRSLLGFVEDQTVCNKSNIILRVSETKYIPQKILLSTKIKTLTLSMVQMDSRLAFAQMRLNRSPLLKRLGVDLDLLASIAARATEGASLDLLNDLFIESENDQSLQSVDDFSDKLKTLKNGYRFTAWSGSELRNQLMSLDQLLGKSVKGQEHALKAIKHRMADAYVGLGQALKQDRPPRAILFLAGPTGTGKTMVIKELSQQLYGHQDLIRLNGGEFQMEHSVEKLIGAPPGYIGHGSPSALEKQLDAKPNSIVLIDEIDKAHPKLLLTLMSILDDGQLTTAAGKVLDFSESVICFTSNYGMYDELQNPSGVGTHFIPRFQFSDSYETVSAMIQQGVRQFFEQRIGRPEIMGRLANAVIAFDFIRDARPIVSNQVAAIAKLLKDKHHFDLDVAPDVIDRIVSEYQQNHSSLILGVRGIRPYLDQYVITPLNLYVFEAAQSGGRITASLDNNQTVIRRC